MQFLAKASQAAFKASRKQYSSHIGIVVGDACHPHLQRLTSLPDPIPRLQWIGDAVYHVLGWTTKVHQQPPKTPTEE